ncbi:hypothetical protein [Streptomyces liliifuscus]|uniref:Uncharacterized protein n=1 Tax=Streptomyces liliifuscus TaxID=2797636 RepID=A0A7T7L2C7_9ACTN|nr:hypothetical protein [Streptomyces liliifuscus]QQM45188.1 hypothetical protein JEQ17_41155 [Streptomyces liliifuscus]
MSNDTAHVVWSRETWDAAGKATGYMLARLCPLCPDPNGTRFGVQGGQSFTIPADWNATSFAITVPAEGDESTVVWTPCGHRIIVEGRLNEPRRDRSLTGIAFAPIARALPFLH